jgi:hypothetical protein
MTTLKQTLCRPRTGRSLVADVATALRRRLAMVRQLVGRRSPARTLIWLSAAVAKALIAGLTLAFVFFAVDVPPGMVVAFVLAPPALALALACIRGLCRRQNARCRRAERTRRLEVEQARALAEARLALLQAHVDPDFLFNSLANLQHLMRKDPIKADAMLAHLVQYLRLSLPSLRSDASTLGAQLDLVDAYLQLASIRLGRRVFAQVSCPPELKGVPFPPMVIHGLADNALRHGAEPCTTPVVIQVRAYTMLGRLIVDVQDDGVGLGDGPKSFGGRGLPNIRTRLKAHFEGRARLSVVSNPGRGVLSRIEVLDLTADEEGIGRESRSLKS